MEKKEEQPKECPICFELFKPPIYQCYNGHIVCNDCLNSKNPITKCPICRDPWPKLPIRIRSLAAEELVRNQIYDCPSRNLNCNAKLKFEDIDDHKRDCPFSEKCYCRLIGLRCSEKHDRLAIVPHLRLSHFDHCKELRNGKHVIRNDSSNDGCLLEGSWNFTVTCRTSYNNKQMNLNQSIMPLWTEFDGHLIFFKQAFNSEQQLLQCGIRLDGSNKTAEDYRFKIKLFSEISPDTSVEWSSSKLPILDQVSKSNHRTFNIPILTLQDLQNSSAVTGAVPTLSSLSWTIEITISKNVQTTPVPTENYVSTLSPSQEVACNNTSLNSTSVATANASLDDSGFVPASSSGNLNSSADSESDSSIKNHQVEQGSSKKNGSATTEEQSTQRILTRNSSWLFSSFSKKNKQN